MTATTKRFVSKNGLDNSGNSITNIGVSGSSLTLSGANGLTLTTTGSTNITLPTSGTLLTTTGTIALATNIASGGTNSLPYQSAAGTTVFLSQGTGVLQETASAPIWTTTPTLTGTNFTAIPNAALTNSAVTIGSTSVSLGATASSLTGLTSVSATTFTGSLTGAASSAASAPWSGLTAPTVSNSVTATLNTTQTLLGHFDTSATSLQALFALGEDVASTKTSLPNQHASLLTLSTLASSTISAVSVNVRGQNNVFRIDQFGDLTYSGVSSSILAAAGSTLTLTGGAGDTTNTGGSMSFSGGSAAGGSGGAVTIQGGNDSSSGAGGNVTISGGTSTSGTSGTVSISGSSVTIAAATLTGTPVAPTAANGTNTAQIATTAFVKTNGIYDFAVNVMGKPNASDIVGNYAAVRAFSFPSSFTGSVSKSQVSATASTVFTISKNGSSIGSITFASSATSATFSGAGGSFAINDILTITAPATPDTTLSGIAITLLGSIA